MARDTETVVSRLIGFRKFAVMLIFLSTMIVFRVYGLIDGGQFSENLRMAIVAFFGANLTEHLVESAKKYIESKFK